jgi:hypothetical protein
MLSDGPEGFPPGLDPDQLELSRSGAFLASPRPARGTVRQSRARSATPGPRPGSEITARSAAPGARTEASAGDSRHLGNNIELCDPPSRKNDTRRALHKLRDQLRPLAPKRCAECGIARLPEWGPKGDGPRARVDHVDVMIRQSARGERAHFHGVIRCASPFVCPVCSAQLRAERANTVVQCVQWWRDQGDGREVELLTLTLRHELGHDLSVTDRALKQAWRSLVQGKPWKRLARRLGICYYIRGRDDTHGAAGWHPHYHVVVFTQASVGPRARAAAITQLRRRWAHCVRRVVGAEYVPTWRGVDLRVCKRDEYIAKLGLEIVSPTTKVARNGGLTPWQIAQLAAAGDDRARGLWKAYVRAIKGSRQLTWSRGLRQAAGVEDERTDQQIVDGAGDDVDETQVASIPADIWEDVASKPGALYAVIQAAESGGLLAVATSIALYRWGLSPPERGANPDQLILDLALEIAPRCSIAAQLRGHAQSSTFLQAS